MIFGGVDFEKLVLTESEQKDFEKYAKIKGVYLHKQVYAVLLSYNSEQVSYSELSSVIRYDKNLRDKLYIYLATFEKSLRAELFSKYDVVIIRNKTVNNAVQTEILRHYKDEIPKRWAFEQLPDMTDASKQFAKIRGAGMWQDLRKRYYDKKSFQLLHEAVDETLKEFGV